MNHFNNFIFVAFLCCAISLEIFGLDFECQTHLNYTLDEVYPCECALDRGNATILNCDLSKCPKKAHHLRQRCNFEDTWKKDCNQCWCRMIGIVCTNNTCEAAVPLQQQ